VFSGRTRRARASASSRHFLPRGPAAGRGVRLAHAGASLRALGPDARKHNYRLGRRDLRVGHLTPYRSEVLDDGEREARRATWLSAGCCRNSIDRSFSTGLLNTSEKRKAGVHEPRTSSIIVQPFRVLSRQDAGPNIRPASDGGWAIKPVSRTHRRRVVFDRSLSDRSDPWITVASPI
jgi:hypothetical protein